MLIKVHKIMVLWLESCISHCTLILAKNFNRGSNMFCMSSLSNFMKALVLSNLLSCYIPCFYFKISLEIKAHSPLCKTVET